MSVDKYRPAYHGHFADCGALQARPSPSVSLAFWFHCSWSSTDQKAVVTWCCVHVRRCQQVVYCSKACQKKHWGPGAGGGNHKSYCRSASDIRDAAVANSKLPLPSTFIAEGDVVSVPRFECAAGGKISVSPETCGDTSAVRVPGSCYSMAMLCFSRFANLHDMKSPTDHGGNQRDPALAGWGRLINHGRG